MVASSDDLRMGEEWPSYEGCFWSMEIIDSLRASMLVRFLAFMAIGEEVEVDADAARLALLASGVLCPTVTLPSLLVCGVLEPLAEGGDSSSITPVSVDCEAAAAGPVLDEAFGACCFKVAEDPVEVEAEEGEALDSSCFCKSTDRPEGVFWLDTTGVLERCNASGESLPLIALG